MMIRHILTVCAVAAVGAAASQVHAQQVYSAPSGAYSPAPTVYPADVRARADQTPDFDSLDEDDANANGVALPPPGVMPPQGPVLSPNDPRYGRPTNAPVYGAVPQGPVMSPDDPRYGRPANAPVYGAAPQGPVMSPDDPRYGRPAGAPPVYADRPNGPPQQGYGDSYIPRPSQGVDAAAPPVARDSAGRPMTVASLPPEEQPDASPAVLPPNLRRQEVDFATKEPAGTIVVDTPNTYLYFVLGNGRAMRYGVRVGRDGFTWTGVQKITRKKEWPDWYPPSEMIERQPYLPRFMAGGEGNPLGARAMYLGSTVYRIHGTNQPSTIGKFVSSGCIGMINDDVSDLFERAKVGTRVVVLPANPQTTASAAAVAAQGMAPGPQPTNMQPLPPPVTVR